MVSERKREREKEDHKRYLDAFKVFERVIDGLNLILFNILYTVHCTLETVKEKDTVPFYP